MLAAIVWPLVGIGGLLVAAGLLLLVLAQVRRSPEPQRIESVASPAAELTGPVIRYLPAITWPLRIDEGADVATFTIEERRRVIDALALIGDPWCAEILAIAYREEVEALKETVIDAIGRCRGEVAPTLERALRSYRTVERYAAVDAASKRGEVALLEIGIRDTDDTVALAAAYGLVRAGRRAEIEAALIDRSDARAAEIRRVLTVLAAFALVILSGVPHGAAAQSPAPDTPRIHLQRPGTDIDADDLIGNMRYERYSLRGHVVVTSDPKTDPDAALTESDDPLTLEADQIDVDRKTQRYDAIGHVSYKQGLRYGTADSATLDANTHDLDLIGHAILGQGGQKLHADRIHYNTKSRKYEAVDNVEAVSPVPTPTPYTGKPTPPPKKKKIPLPL